MVGAMVLARLVDDEKLSKEILTEACASLPLFNMLETSLSYAAGTGYD